MKNLNLLKKSWQGVLLAIGVGLLGVAIRAYTDMPILDPLFIAMLIGIIIRGLVKFPKNTIDGFKLVHLICIPPGVLLYGAVNLNFRITSVFQEIDFIIIALFVFIVYLSSALFLSSLFGLKEKVGYLIAAGSSICGASAIAITSGAIDADSDEISVSLVSIFISGLIGVFFIVPFAVKYFNLPLTNYGVFAGSVLQFTGFVKAAAAGLPRETQIVALSIKALRYLGLLFVIPLFSSLVKRKLYVPWYIALFVLAGIVFSIMPSLANIARPILTPILTITWSIAMAGIGLNADIKRLFTIAGVKAMLVSMIALLIAAGAFLIANYFLLGSTEILF